MKKIAVSLIIIAFSMSVLFTAGCINDNPNLGPSDMTSQAPDESPTSAPIQGQVIEGFKEGTIVKPDDVPDIVDAVKSAYPEAVIKGIVQTAYLADQAYDIILEQPYGYIYIYALPDGTIVPYWDNYLGNKN